MPMLYTSGADLHYLKEGRGPAVLLIHGMGVVSEFWRPQIERLGDRYTVVAPDNRGLGHSSINDGTLTIEAMARDALAILDAEGIERVHVVGHSMGGVIAQAVALEARSRVVTLALLCTISRGRDAWPSLPLLWQALRTRIGTRRMCRDAYLDLAFSQAFLDRTGREDAAALLARLFGRQINRQPPIVIRQAGALLRYDARNRLPSLAGLPTLVISTAGDRLLSPARGRALAGMIPGARYVEIADAGHALPIERADEVTGLLAAHFESAESGGAFTQ
jgi:pimeloyl-ACP methyl ester carboxylesterase